MFGSPVQGMEISYIKASETEGSRWFFGEIYPCLEKYILDQGEGKAAVLDDFYPHLSERLYSVPKECMVRGELSIEETKPERFGLVLYTDEVCEVVGKVGGTRIGRGKRKGDGAKMIFENVEGSMEFTVIDDGEVKELMEKYLGVDSERPMEEIVKLF